MEEQNHPFPSRLLNLDQELEAGRAAGTEVDPRKINQHLEGEPGNPRVMTDAEVTSQLGDPFATLVLRRGLLPDNLTELLAALDAHDATPDGLPLKSSFLVAEGGQIPFRPGVAKGGSRLITVRGRGRGNSPELMISSLVPAGQSPRADQVLNEVIAWDPTNRTFHYYQRQRGAWFWCGQSDMALVAPTRGNGPFDSHVNGYVVMKELKTPWVHWHGPGLGISERAYAPDDPLVRDPLFLAKDHALNFENNVMRPLMARWNKARFDKATRRRQLTGIRLFGSQLLESTSANLISTHTEATQLPGKDLDDLPPTFFVDLDCLAGEVGLEIDVPPLAMSGARYAALIATHDLRVRGEGVDQQGDVPFCFTVPERAHEDVIVVGELIRREALSARLAACLLMVDFPNPVGSRRRAALARHLPDEAGLTPRTNLDATLVPVLQAAAAASAEGSPEREFAAHWDLGPAAWQAAFATRVNAYLRLAAQRLATDAGSDEVFRLAESRRREFRRRPLIEFGLTLPVAVNIPATTRPLDMTERATIRNRR
jgi:hypothetical protein